MQFGIIIIGDEILNGSRTDSHFSFFKQIMQQHGLGIAWVEYLPDGRSIITKKLQQSFSENNPVFVTGGIGATPDDHTRQACAQALGVPLKRHSEAIKMIETISLQNGDSLDSPTHLQRAKMADFPEHAALIPNPFNKIAGFSIKEHYFLPGFPRMAHPMAQWVLNQYYQNSFFLEKKVVKAALIDGLPESIIAPLMERIEQQFSGIKTYSLPTIREDLPESQQKHHYRLEFGMKARSDNCANLLIAWKETMHQLKVLGAKNITLLEKGSEE